ncbi:DUF6478 family protein [Paracoccus tegillarcae]|nr:DUF6478 family protein [Paracoccus tegillarcae]
MRDRVSSADMAELSPETCALPPGTDWSWRPAVLSQALPDPEHVAPASGRRLSDEMALWHDCPDKALTLRQRPQTDGAPFDLLLEVPRFGGSYLSVSFDLPASAMNGLTSAHILRLATVLRSQEGASIYARLNVTHGPNTENILRHVDLTRSDPSGRYLVEFDLAGTDLNQNRLEKIWLDLIVEQPRLESVTLAELVMSRHLRANF